MSGQDHHDRIFEILYNPQDEIMWQQILVDLVKSEQMDPWNIDVSLISNKYIRKVKELSDHDFRVSGKVLLAAAILLKLKSERLVGTDFEEFDKLLAEAQQSEDELLDSYEDGELIPPLKGLGNEQIPPLIPRTPQPRQRKVSIYDLVSALRQALEVKKRRVVRKEEYLDVKINVPQKGKDITEIIKEVYAKIKGFFDGGKQEILFTELLASKKREDRIHTFVPLLHLAHQNKIDLDQPKPFGEIHIKHKAKA